MTPRISPGSQAETGRLNALIVAAIHRVARTEDPPHLFGTLARHRGLFRAWLMFAGRLMPRGKLARQDSELVILRVAHLCDCAYEWGHHEHIARSVGLSAEAVQRVREGSDAGGWNPHEALLLRAVDELHATRRLSDEVWAALRGELTEVQLIELCLLAGHYEMLAMTINSLQIEPDRMRAPGGSSGPHPLAGRRVLITGAARGIGAATARRLHSRGARVALLGLEPELLEQLSHECGGAPWYPCDVREREQVEQAVESAVQQLGGLDVVMANAGVAAQLPLLGGDPSVFERTIAVNLLGVFYTLRAAAPHIAHPAGYALAISSLAAAVHLPMLGAYNASKAGVEALGDSLRIELASSGARVGVAYFGELETDMTRRGFGTDAAAKLMSINRGPFAKVTPLESGIDAIERGMVRRSRRVVAPGWVAGVLPIRMLAQRVVDKATAGQRLDEALEIARAENAPLTTPQP